MCGHRVARRHVAGKPAHWVPETDVIVIRQSVEGADGRLADGAGESVGRRLHLCASAGHNLDRHHDGGRCGLGGGREKKQSERSRRQRRGWRAHEVPPSKRNRKEYRTQTTRAQDFCGVPGVPRGPLVLGPAVPSRERFRGLAAWCRSFRSPRAARSGALGGPTHIIRSSTSLPDGTLPPPGSIALAASATASASNMWSQYRSRSSNPRTA